MISKLETRGTWAELTNWGFNMLEPTFARISTGTLLPPHRLGIGQKDLRCGVKVLSPEFCIFPSIRPQGDFLRHRRWAGVTTKGG